MHWSIKKDASIKLGHMKLKLVKIYVSKLNISIFQVINYYTKKQSYQHPITKIIFL